MTHADAIRDALDEISEIESRLRRLKSVLLSTQEPVKRVSVKRGDFRAIANKVLEGRK